MTRLAEMMALAAHAARDSQDPKTAVGCVVHHPERGVLVVAANRLPPGLANGDSTRLAAPAKYFWIEHAERAALMVAARDGIATAGAAAFVHGGFPCADCARAIIAAGLVEVAFSLGRSEVAHWEDSYGASRTMLAEAGVRVTEMPRAD